MEEVLHSLKTGQTLQSTLHLLNITSRSEFLKSITTDLMNYIEQGYRFGEAIERSQRFDATITSFLKNGDATGNLIKSIELSIRLLKRNIQLKQELKKVALYPIIVMSTLICVLFLMGKFMLPQFIKMFASYNATLPQITLVIMNVTEGVVKNFNLYFLGFLIMIGLIRRIGSMPLTRRNIEQILLKFTFFKEPYTDYRTFEFSYLLEAYLGSGALLEESLKLIQKNTTSYVLKDVLEKNMDNIHQGEKLHETLKRCPIISMRFLEMIKIADRTGDLKNILNTNVEYYDIKYQRRLEKLLIYVEPALTIFMALIVGVIVLAIMLPTLYLTTQVM